MRAFVTALLAAGAAAAFSAGASAATITFQNGLNGYAGTSDAFVPANDHNYGGNTSVDFYTTSKGVIYPAIIRFDVSSLNGVASSVNSATLILYEEKTSNLSPDTFPVDVYTVNANDAGWVQGTGSSGNGLAVSTGDSTGLHLHYPSTNWASGGAFGTGDYSASSVASYTYSNLVANGTPINISLPTSVAQGWITGANAGLALVNPSNADPAFYSSEYGTQSVRPALVIDYTPVPEPVTGSLLLIGGGLLALRRRRS